MTARQAGPAAPRGVPPPPFLLTALLLGAASASRFLAIALAPSENDEAVFSGAVTRFDLYELSPQAPGFPVWILLGRLFAPLLDSPFLALAAVSTVLSALALPALWVWGRSLVGEWAALGGTLLAASLPVIWVNGGRALSDSPGTAFLLCALAALTLLDEECGEGRAGKLRALSLAAAAGFLTAAGGGVRPHLVTVFGPLFLVLVVRLVRADGKAARVFVASVLAGTAAWMTWLVAHAGGLEALRSSFVERAEFRSYGIATGHVGGLAESFVLRSFVTPKRAAVLLALALVGLAVLWVRRRRAAFDLTVFLVPAFLSLWFLHGRSVTRYSVPFVFVVALLVAFGIEALARWRPLGLAGALAVAAFYARDGWETVRASAVVVPPPMAAIDALEHYAYAGRETIVADEVFEKFLRTERWQRRLSGWPYTDAELVARPLRTNRRLVRLADFTGEPESSWIGDPLWRIWKREGRVLDALHQPRLQVVGVRDPAPPLFGVGFGVREYRGERGSVRWAGPSAHLVVPGLVGPPVAFLEGERPEDGGATTLTVREARTGRFVMSQKVEPGAFELMLADAPVFGPLERSEEYVLSCDRPVPLPPFPGGLRPAQGCFLFRDATRSFLPDQLWERLGWWEYRVDVGTSRDDLVGLKGFFDRETDPATSADYRWATGDASVLWMPIPSLTPRLLAVRGHAPGSDPVEVTLFVGDVRAGSVRFDGGSFSEGRVELSREAVALLTGPLPVRIRLSSATVSPKRLGRGEDARELGIAVDRIIVR